MRNIVEALGAIGAVAGFTVLGIQSSKVCSMGLRTSWEGLLATFILTLSCYLAYSTLLLH
jgi:hypothetical protein